MTLRVVYRAAPSGGPKPRPEWFSKAVCLSSYVLSLRAAGARPIATTFLCDGPLPAEVLAVMATVGEVVETGGIGNVGSARMALNVALQQTTAGDSCYFLEDDYLHSSTSVSAVYDAIQDAKPGAFLSPYDHPDRYRRNDDLRVPGAAVRLLGDRHWRAIESTTMTFACSRADLARDVWLLRFWSGSWFKYPHDRLMWRSVQALGPFAPLRLRRGPSRHLLSALPGPATHSEVDQLGPCTDWREMASAATDHAEQLGIRSVEW